MDSRPAYAKSSILQRQLLRAAVFLLILAGLFFGYQWFSNYIVDPDSGTAETAGWIAAIENTNSGSRAVVIRPDGKVESAPGSSETTTDKDVVWRPDGNRVFFSSDRADDKANASKAFQIVRWNLATGQAEIRTVGTRSKARLNFSPPGYEGKKTTGMLVAGGFVYEFDPRAGTLRQVLPPVVGAQASDEESGAGGQFDAIYRSMGTSFKDAKWLKDRNVAVAVMRRDNGEAIILQPLGMQTDDKGNQSFPRPIALAAGQSIDFDVNANGDFVYTVTGLQPLDPRDVPEEYKKDGKIVLPYQHAIFVGRFEDNKPVVQTVAVSNDNKTVFGRVRFSPDGKEMLVQGGVIGSNGTFDINALVLVPAIEGGAQDGRIVVPGEVSDFAWAPRGDRFAFVVKGKSRGLYIANRDGSEPKRVGSENSDYSDPHFSPQTGK